MIRLTKLENSSPASPHWKEYLKDVFKTEKKLSGKRCQKKENDFNKSK